MSSSVIVKNQIISEDSLEKELDDIFDSINDIKHYDKRICYLDKNVKRTKLVLSGGGVKLMAFIGALTALNDMGILEHITTIAATSAGAIIAFLLSIGYTIDELFDVITLLDFKKLKLLEFHRLLTEFGLDDGKRMEFLVHSLMAAKNIDINISFRKLYEMTGKTLIMTATCVNDKKIHYFSHKTAPDMSILTALRMTISVPIFFTPVLYKGKYYIDGGCIDNFPIHLFDDNLDDVIGIYLDTDRNDATNITNIEEYLCHTIFSFLEGHKIGSLLGVEKYIIQISFKNIGFIDFNIDKTTKQLIYDKSYDTVMSRFK